MRHLGKTAPFRGPDGRILPGSIAEVKYLRLGGIDPGIPRSSMTVEQLISDLGELVDAVRARVGKEQVVLFGHSWGSALGVLYSARFPRKVAAYVGSGQLGDAAAAEAASYAYVLAKAERLGNGKAVLRMPVFFFLGRQDHFVPPETSVAYFDALFAPSKKLLWFEESGHEPFVDEPSKFNAAMEQLVRPAVERRPSREEQPEAHP